MFELPSISLLAVVFIALVCVVLGFAIGSLVGARTGDKTPSDAPPGGRAGAYISLLRLWRERKPPNKLVVEFDETAYIAPDPLTLDQRQRLVDLLAEEATWLGLVEETAGKIPLKPAASLEVSAVSPQSTTQPTNEIPQDKTVVAVPSAPTPVTLPEAETPSSTIQPPVPPPPVPARQYFPPPPPAPPVEVVKTKEPPKTIVEQIDEILQENILGTPLEQRRIHLAPDLRRGAVVWVGSEHFDSLDQVPYPDVREAIRTAVKTWEQAAK